MTAPLVSALIVAHDHERYLGRAIDSVLGQDYPADRLELVVVDDGSTDGTADVARGYGDRVRLVRLDGVGHLEAFSRGLAATTGDAIALLDGDDAWLPDKTRRQVDVLVARPEVGVVFGDVRVVDAGERTLHESRWQNEGIVPHAGRALGPLLVSNFTQTSALMVRAAYRDRFHPIPPWSRAQDWWIAARVAEVAELAYVDGPVALYRSHEGNLSFGGSLDKFVGLRRREIPFRRWLLTRMPLESLEPGYVLGAVQELQRTIAIVARGQRLRPSEFVEVDARERDAALDGAEAALDLLARGEPLGAALALARACAHDPLNEHVTATLGRVVGQLTGNAPADEPSRGRSERLDDVRGFVTVAAASELLARPALLRSYCDAFGRDDDATLLVAAAAGEEAAFERAFLELAIPAEAAPDVYVVTADGGGFAAPLVATAQALLSAEPPPPAFANRAVAAGGEDLREAAGREWSRRARVRATAGRLPSFCLKICVPAWTGSENWGDLHFARALQGELERRGHGSAVQVIREWDGADAAAFDVALHLRGLSPYVPKPGQLNVLWAISHPDLLTPRECDRYDLVFVASQRLRERLAPLTRTPVHVLEQATDPGVFFPDSDPAFRHDLVFVGNSRLVRRKILDDLLPTSHDLAVWGSGWEELIDPRHLVGTYLPNDRVRRAYSSATVVLNDHWGDMRESGLVSNRIYDALACGAFVISDDVPGLERFGGAVAAYRTRDELHALVEHALAHPGETRERGAAGREVVLAGHTFAHRVDTLLERVLPCLATRREAAA